MTSPIAPAMTSRVGILPSCPSTHTEKHFETSRKERRERIANDTAQNRTGENAEEPRKRESEDSKFRMP